VENILGGATYCALSLAIPITAVSTPSSAPPELWAAVGQSRKTR
jgi:hypothetical protein